jgi:hypothetical protein
MNLQRQTVLTTALALVLLLAVAPVSGAENRGDSLAAVSALGDQVAWVPQSGAGRFLLVVSGPGVDFAQRFDGDAPAFSLFDERGNSLPDGIYKWELREEMAPVNDRVRDPENGREGAEGAGTRRTEFAGRIQSGSFAVVNGGLAESGVTEAEAGRPVKN